ncbi:MAG: divalent-cation tolerance protein CutA [Kiloniellales bacterium]|nr:divalent-cation tolerance protein CutA [Kiloniellales bacterium]
MRATLVMVTFPSAEAARAIGRALVEARLAASVNIAENVASLYWWEGAVREGAEALLFAKTRDDLVERLTGFVKERHPYVCPAIYATPITAGNPDYLAWIETETAGE